MKNTFTPRPWNAGGLKPKGNEANIFDTSTPEQLICRAYGSIDQKCPPLDEQIANSHLIAAAPDLFEACKEALKMYETIEPVGGWQHVHDLLLYALKKAKL